MWRSSQRSFQTAWKWPQSVLMSFLAQACPVCLSSCSRSRWYVSWKSMIEVAMRPRRKCCHPIACWCVAARCIEWVRGKRRFEVGSRNHWSRLLEMSSLMGCAVLLVWKKLCRVTLRNRVRCARRIGCGHRSRCAFFSYTVLQCGQRCSSRGLCRCTSWPVGSQSIEYLSSCWCGLLS